MNEKKHTKAAHHRDNTQAPSHDSDSTPQDGAHHSATPETEQWETFGYKPEWTSSFEEGEEPTPSTADKLRERARLTLESAAQHELDLRYADDNPEDAPEENVTAARRRRKRRRIGVIAAVSIAIIAAGITLGSHTAQPKVETKDTSGTKTILQNEQEGSTETGLTLPDLTHGKSSLKVDLTPTASSAARFKLPEGIGTTGYVLHFHADADSLEQNAQCDARFTAHVPSVAEGSTYERVFDLDNLCAPEKRQENGGLDASFPLDVLYDYGYEPENSFMTVDIRGIGAVLDVSVYDLASAPALEWNGEDALTGSGNAFIRTSNPPAGILVTFSEPSEAIVYDTTVYDGHHIDHSFLKSNPDAEKEYYSITVRDYYFENSIDMKTAQSMVTYIFIDAQGSQAQWTVR